MFRYFATAFLTLTLVSTVAFADTPNTTTNSTGNAVTVEGTNTGNTNTTTTDGTTTNTTGTAIPATGTTGTTGTATTVPNENTTVTTVTTEGDASEEIAKTILDSKSESEIFEEILKVWSQDSSTNKWVMLVFLCLFLILKVVFRFVPVFTKIDEKLGTSKWKSPAIVAIVTGMSVIVSLATGGASWDVAMNAAVVAMGAIGMNESWKGVVQSFSSKDFTKESPASKKEEAAEATSA